VLVDVVLPLDAGQLVDVCTRTVWVFRVLSALGDWLSAGGFVITAACLASVATLILILSAAVCLVRWRLRRRRRKMLPPTTKIELQETPSDEPAAPAGDPLLAEEMGQLSDVAMTEFESEPVRYVVSHNTLYFYHFQLTISDFSLPFYFTYFSSYINAFWTDSVEVR